MAHQRAAFDFTPTPEEERATMRKILAHLAPKTKDDVQMIAAALKTHGPKFEDIFLEWATPYGRYKAKGLWERTKADPDAITEVIERQLAAESRNKRFEALPVYALEALPSLRWCIKSVFPSVGVVAVYGPSGSGKSFLAISIAASIAEGSPFFGHVTRPAAVLYVGLEGEGGYKGRVIAWQRIKGRTMADGVAFILQPFCLTNPQDVADLAAICPAGCVVIIDTLNRASPGMDENSSRDMGAAIDGAKMLQQLVAGLVVLIAHTGKDSTRGLRGHSSLFAALDAAILVSREGDVRSWKVDKAKDGKDGEIHRFVLQTVDVGTDEDGDVITSCAVVPDTSQPTTHEKPLTTNQKLGLQSFREAASDHGGIDEQGNFLGLHLHNWRPAFYRLSSADSDTAKKKAFERARKDLIERGRLAVENNVYRLVGDGSVLAEQCIAEVLKTTRDTTTRQRQLSDMSPVTSSLLGDDSDNTPLGVSHVLGDMTNNLSAIRAPMWATKSER